MTTKENDNKSTSTGCVFVYLKRLLTKVGPVTTIQKSKVDGGVDIEGFGDEEGRVFLTRLNPQKSFPAITGSVREDSP